MFLQTPHFLPKDASICSNSEGSRWVDDEEILFLLFNDPVGLPFVFLIIGLLNVLANWILANSATLLIIVACS